MKVKPRQTQVNSWKAGGRTRSRAIIKSSDSAAPRECPGTVCRPGLSARTVAAAVLASLCSGSLTQFTAYMQRLQLEMSKFLGLDRYALSWP